MTKGKIKNLDFLKIQKFCVVNNIIKKMGRQLIEWGKVFAIIYLIRISIVDHLLETGSVSALVSRTDQQTWFLPLWIFWFCEGDYKLKNHEG